MKVPRFLLSNVFFTKKNFIFKTKNFLQYINLTCFITLNFMTYEWPFRFIESEQKYILLKLHCDTLLNVFQKFYSTEIDEKSSREDLGSHHCINSVIINPVFPIILHLKIKTDAYLPLSKYNHDYINAGSQNCDNMYESADHTIIIPLQLLINK